MTQQKTIDYLIETVAFIVETSGQSNRPTAYVCFPDAICDLCASLGHDPWVLLNVYRKEIGKEQRPPLRLALRANKNVNQKKLLEVLRRARRN